MLSPSALPLPTGGLTHVFEVTAMLLALQLMIGRREVWLPARWQRLELGGDSREQFIAALLRRLRWLERFARPALALALRAAGERPIFGTLTLAAFLAPPFSGLDTLPSLGVVALALSVLIEDLLLAEAAS